VVAELAEQLAAESGKLRKRALLAEVLARVAASDVRDAGRVALYVAGQPFAEADARKLQVGGSLLVRAIVAVSGTTEAALGAAMRVHGDMGAAACDVFAQRATGVAGPLTLEEMAESFALLAVAGGTARRQAIVEALLGRASALEAKYLVKLMLGDMRIGVKQSLVEEAIAAASAQPVEAVRRAVMLEADLERVVERAFAGTLAEARMQLFHPLGFMLASPVASPEEAVERFAPEVEDEAALAELTDYEAAIAQVQIDALLEDKFDGIRAQLHVGAGDAGGGRVAIYSRTREEITESFPELVEAFAETAPAGGVILDGELLAWEFATETALPFSALGQRIGRKRVDAAMRRAVPVVFMAFDVLYAGGALLLEEPLQARRARLETLVTELAPRALAPLEPVERSAQASLFAAASEAASLPRLRLSAAQRVEDAAAIDRAYVAARARGNEGVILKAMQSVYQPGRRGLAWCKLKRELATLDVVITGAEFGHGRRAGLLSDYTFAVRGADGGLLNVGKAYSGLTDAEIAAMTAWLEAHTLDDRGHFRTVEPLRVLEVAFNNVMRSDRHASGFALRFPRILRIRDDKPVEEIDTLARVEAIYQSQPDKPRG
jgi:DNA ligase-1